MSRFLLIAPVVALLALTACSSGSPAADPSSIASSPGSTSVTVPGPTTPPPAGTTAARPSTPSPDPAAAPRATSTSALRPSARVTLPTTTELPLDEPTGDATQVITVLAPSTSSTSATVQAWIRSGSAWVRHGAAIAGHTGSAGLTTHPTESVSATPIGSFTLTQAFGIDADPGTALPYFRVGPDDYWVSDPSASCYNTHQVLGRTSCRFDTGDGENLLQAGYVYSYAVDIDYHDTYPAGGSAFFLHVSNGRPTAGCVSIPEADLVSILRWLQPSDHPRILIGI